MALRRGLTAVGRLSGSGGGVTCTGTAAAGWLLAPARCGLRPKRIEDRVLGAAAACERDEPLTPKRGAVLTCTEPFARPGAPWSTSPFSSSSRAGAFGSSETSLSSTTSGTASRGPSGDLPPTGAGRPAGRDRLQEELASSAWAETECAPASFDCAGERRQHCRFRQAGRTRHWPRRKRPLDALQRADDE